MGQDDRGVKIKKAAEEENKGENERQSADERMKPRLRRDTKT